MRVTLKALNMLGLLCWMPALGCCFTRSFGNDADLRRSDGSVLALSSSSWPAGMLNSMDFRLTDLPGACNDDFFCCIGCGESVMRFCGGSVLVLGAGTWAGGFSSGGPSSVSVCSWPRRERIRCDAPNDNDWLSSPACQHKQQSSNVHIACFPMQWGG